MADSATPAGQLGARPRPSAPRGILAAAVIVAITVAVASVGGLVTDPDSGWYRSLEKPPFNPPGAVFGPVWAVLYILAATSAWLAWRDVRGDDRAAVLWLFAANAVMNLAWTLIFFGAESPLAAAFEIIPLLISIVLLIRLLLPWNKFAAWALVPYALWVAFATALTWTIAIANV